MITSLLREYLEGHGLHLAQRRYWLGGSRRLPGEERIVLEWEPLAESIEQSFYLFSNQLTSMPKGLLWVYPPMFEGFSSAVVRKPDQLLKFVQSRINKNFQSERDFFQEVARESKSSLYLLIPAFPLREPQKGRLEKSLAAEKVDGVFSFRSVLLDLMAKIEAGQRFSESPALELMRLFKAHDLLSEPQMRLFD